MSSSIKENLALEWRQHLDVFQSLNEIFDEIVRSGEMIVSALSSGNKILLAGNGGSAADAQHIAAELVGRYRNERSALPAIALTTDTSILTAVSNDYGYAEVFARQVEGLAKAGDVLLAYSTSGNSENIIRTVEVARKKGCQVISLTGQGGGALAGLADIALKVPSDSTPRIQECHAFMGHMLCQMVDDAVQEGRIEC